MVINHIGLSGGKDSTALWGWALNESGYDPKTIRGSFCDTGNEYPEVYAQIAKLNEYGIKHGIAPIKTLRNHDPRFAWNQLPLFLALAVWKGRFPSAKVRFCTQFLKIIPTQWFMEELWLDGFDILAHSGVRANESFERSTMTEYGQGGGLGVNIRRPLLKWTISDVWDAHRRYGLPINPLYMKGRKRVGCRLCIMSNKQDVRLTARDNKWVIDQYEQWEIYVGQSCKQRGKKTDYSSFFHRNTVPEQFRSREVDTKSGKMFVATIQDVARWSLTLRGGREIPFDFMYEENFDQDDADGGPCKSGYCE